MSEQGQALRQGQRVWYKGRPAIFLYFTRDAAVIRFEGRSETSVVSSSSLSAAPPDSEAG
jgi:hypothetical protein